MKMRRVFIAACAIALISTPLASATEVLSQDTRMKLVKTLSGDLAPKSVLSSGTGLISAHNMMYKHTVTFFDSESMELVSTVKDSVDLKSFGFSKYSGTYRGAPVEGAFSPDGKYLYFTNYAMYGKGFRKEGTDTCSPSSGYDTSFLSRINLSTYTIDAVYPVGSVPKVVQVTPDNKYILVSNWCSYTLSVISVAEQKAILASGELDRIKQAQVRVANNKKEISLDQIVSELPLGFWATLLGRRYRNLWPELAGGFLGLASRDSMELAKLVQQARWLRNRIGHHHRIWNLDLENHHLGILRISSMVDPEFERWLSSVSPVPELLIHRPRTTP
jgi:hypothetical protein